MRQNRVEQVLVCVAIIMIAVAYGFFGYKLGYEKGFDACVQENNLYERYGE